MTAHEMIEVSQERFNTFLKNYGTPLERGVSTICVPPISHYLDRSVESKYEVGTGEYFSDAEVCRVILPYLPGDPYTYFIREDFLKEESV